MNVKPFATIYLLEISTELYGNVYATNLEFYSGRGWIWPPNFPMQYNTDDLMRPKPAAKTNKDAYGHMVLDADSKITFLPMSDRVEGLFCWVKYDG